MAKYSSSQHSELKIVFRDEESDENSSKSDLLLTYLNENNIKFTLFTTYPPSHEFSGCSLKLVDKATDRFVGWLAEQKWVKSITVKDILIKTETFNIEMVHNVHS